MPVSIPVALPEIAFSKNQLDLGIASDDYLTAAAATAVNFLQFTAPVAEDDFVDLIWNLSNAVMTAKNAPDDSGNEFPSGAGDWTYVQTLVDWFQGNYFIDLYFTVTADNTGLSPRLVFTAKAAGADYNFTVAGDIGVITAGVTSLPKENFEHHTQLWLDNYPDQDELVYAANNPLDDPLTGKTTIDIHEALHAFLDHDRPEMVNPYALCTNSVRKYYPKYAQFFGDPASVQKVFRGNSRFIAKGGLGMQPMLLRNIVTELTKIGHPELTRFMRQGSINKLVSKEQPEWLTYINLKGSEQTIVPVVTIYNSDSSTFSFDIIEGLTLDPCTKVQFKTGYTQLDIDSRQVGKTPIYWTVQLLEAGSPATQAYAYIIDNKFREWQRYIIYENSYGAYQTIAMVGKAQDEYDRLKDDAQLAVPLKIAASAGAFIECNIFIQDKSTVSIGYDRANRRDTELLRDLLLAHDKYVYDALNNKLVPIGLNTNNLKDWQDGQNLGANTLEYYLLYQEEVWTEDPLKVLDDDIAELLEVAGIDLPSGATTGQYFYVKAGDAGIGVDGDGNFQFIDPLNRIKGKTGYLVYATQLAAAILPPNITYNLVEGSFAILIPDFAIVDGYPLIVFTNNIDVL